MGIVSSKSVDVEWIRVADSDSAHVDVSLHLEVTVQSEAGSPRVLDKPVVHTVLSSPSNGEYSVINILGGSSAISSVVYSALVVTEAINDLISDRYWSVGINGVQKTLLISLSNVDGSNSNLIGEALAAYGTWIIFSGVWVALLRADSSSVEDVLESVGWKTTSASVVIEGSGAVNKLLFRSVGEVSTVLNHSVSLNSTNGRESPAATARTLVLDGGNSVMLSPVPGSWSSLDGLDCLGVGGRAVLLSGGVEVEVGLEFVIGHVREFIETLLPFVGWVAVVRDNAIKRVGEGVLSLFVGVMGNLGLVHLVPGEEHLVEGIGGQILATGEVGREVIIDVS